MICCKDHHGAPHQRAVPQILSQKRSGGCKFGGSASVGPFSCPLPNGGHRKSERQTKPFACARKVHLILASFSVRIEVTSRCFWPAVAEEQPAADKACPPWHLVSWLRFVLASGDTARIHGCNQWVVMVVVRRNMVPISGPGHPHVETHRSGATRRFQSPCLALGTFVLSQLHLLLLLVSCGV